MSDVFQESDALKLATDNALRRLARLNMECASMAGRVRAYRDFVTKDMPKETLLKILNRDIEDNDKMHDLPLP